MWAHTRWQRGHWGTGLSPCLVPECYHLLLSTSPVPLPSGFGHWPSAGRMSSLLARRQPQPGTAQHSMAQHGTGSQVPPLPPHSCHLMVGTGKGRQRGRRSLTAGGGNREETPARTCRGRDPRFPEGHHEPGAPRPGTGTGTPSTTLGRSPCARRFQELCRRRFPPRPPARFPPTSSPVPPAPRAAAPASPFLLLPQPRPVPRIARWLPPLPRPGAAAALPSRFPCPSAGPRRPLLPYPRPAPSRCFPALPPAPGPETPPEPPPNLRPEEPRGRTALGPGPGPFPSALPVPPGPAGLAPQPAPLTGRSPRCPALRSPGAQPSQSRCRRTVRLPGPAPPRGAAQPRERDWGRPRPAPPHRAGTPGSRTGGGAAPGHGGG